MIEPRGTPFCTGCGSEETIEQIKARNPEALSCCPERKMVIPLVPNHFRIAFFPTFHERRFGMKKLFDVWAETPIEALQKLYTTHPDAKVHSLVNAALGAEEI